MAAETLPLANPADDAQRFVQQFDQLWQDFDERYNMLRAMRNGPVKASLALETSQDLKSYLEAVDASPMEAQKRRLFEAHRYASDVVKRVRKRAEMFLKFCSDIRSQCELERQRAVEDERRKRESQANLFAQQQREAEVKHLEEIGKPEEAKVRAAAPVIPITVNVDSNAGKPEGETLVEVWVPKRDEAGEIMFTDQTAALTWLTANPAFHHLVQWQFGKLKKILTENRGMLQVPGMIIERKFEARTRRAPSDE
jgi:hypothetical protein